MARTSIDDLLDHTLVHIFELLSFYDRLNLERVCQRWRVLSKWESWTKFRKFSYEEFLLDPEGKYRYPERFSKVVFDKQKRQISYEEFETLFSRCGEYLEELSLEKLQIYEGICFSILPMLPNLKHLHMAELVESEGLLQKLPTWLPQLRSMVFVNLHYALTNSLVSFLGKSQRLEFIRIEKCLMGQLFNNATLYKNGSTKQFLPPNLKCLCVDETVESSQLFKLVGEQCKQLESLSFSAYVLNLDDRMAKRLRCLNVRLESKQKEEFMDILPSLGELRALEIKQVPDKRGPFFSEKEFSKLCDVCKRLEHLSLIGAGSCYLEYASLAHLTSLKKLRSVELRNFDKYNNQPILKVLGLLSENGILENFETDAALPENIICVALKSCKKLRRLELGTLPDSTYDEFCKVLNELYKAEELPKSNEDERVLKVIVTSSIGGIYPIHPWVKVFAQSELDRPCNRVREDIRLGKLSSTASYM